MELPAAEPLPPPFLSPQPAPPEEAVEAPPPEEAVEAPPTMAFAANPTATRLAPSHPPYASMIISAIKALDEKKGSSRKAIAKFIDSAYSSLSQKHKALLTHHLKRLKKKGLVLMVKKSYKLPSFATAPSVADPSAPKRGRGRPRKFPSSSLPPPQHLLGPTKRGRGRPPKVAKPKPVGGSPMVAKPKPIVPSSYFGGPAVSVKRGRPPGALNKPKPVGLPLSPKRGRGRPPSVGNPKPTISPSGSASVKRGRGRPPKMPKLNADAGVEGGGGGAFVVPVHTPTLGGEEGLVAIPPVVVSQGRTRGRPRKFGGVSTPKPKLGSTGRPVGRPRKVPVLME